MAYKMNGIPQLGGDKNDDKDKSKGHIALDSLRDSKTISDPVEVSSEWGESTDGLEWYWTPTKESDDVAPKSTPVGTSIKKPTRKPTPKMDKIPTKGIAKGKKVQAKVKNAPKPKVKETLYNAASILAKQGRAIGYRETKLPGANRVFRSNISAKEYNNKKK